MTPAQRRMWGILQRSLQAMADAIKAYLKETE